MNPFVWDEAKDAENRAKHGIGLDIVYKIDWSNVVYQDDRRFDYGRIALGLSSD